MTKLPLNSLQNIEKIEIKALLKENKAISGFSYFVRDYVWDVLKNEGKFGKEDFEVMKWYIENLLWYENIFKSEFQENIFNINLISKISFWQNKEEFTKFIRNSKIKYLIKNWTPEITKLLFWENFYDIKNKTSLENLFKNPNFDKIKVIIENYDNKIVELLFSKDFYNIKNKNDLEILFKNKHWNDIKYLISNIDNKITNLLFLDDLYKIKNKENLENFFQNGWKRKFLFLIINYGSIIDLYKSQEEFQNNYKNKKEINIVKDYTEKNLENIIKLFNLKSIDEIIKLIYYKKNKILSNLSSEDDKIIEYIVKNLDKDIAKSIITNINLNNLKIEYIESYINIFKSAKTEEQIIKLSEFLNNKVFTSKHNTKLIFKRKYNSDFRNFQKIFMYYLENKQKSLVSMIEKLGFLKDFWVRINLDKFKTIDDFRNENWEIKKDELRTNFEKILKLNWENKSEKYLKQFDNYIKSKNINWLDNLLIENFIKYFENFYHKKVKNKIIQNLNKNSGRQGIDFNSIDDTKLDNPNFIESYKMSVNPKYNKTQINKLLIDYLTWKFDKIEDLNQYNTPENKKWLENNLSKEQQTNWLFPEKKIIEIKNDSEKNNENKNIESKNNDYFEIAIKKINEINKLWFQFESKFNKIWELVNYFDTNISKQEKEIKEKDSNIFEDLKLQINSIKENFKLSKSKKAEKIIIEKELDPLKSLMMWNWVDWSCLSFYSSVWNYYSAISNTIDVNKWVFYIKNENWDILWRCLTSIWEDKKLSRYKMYYNWNVSYDIDWCFSDYIKELAKKIWIWLNWNEDKVKKVECSAWYQDWIKYI